MRAALIAAVITCLPVGVPLAHSEAAIFAGGCFWCVESDLEAVPGVRSVMSGYAGGKTANPTYQTYHDGGHREVVAVDFDETRISYRQLTDIFLRTIDVTDGNGQFCDRGHGYSPVIHAVSPEQEKAAKEAVADAAKLLGKELAVPVEGKATFTAAESYHQNYYKSDKVQLTRFGLVKQSDAYKGYREGCGRDVRVKAVWGSEAYKGVPAH